MTNFSIQELYNKNKQSQPSSGGGTRLGVAIHENLTVTAEAGKSENSGNGYIDLTFTNTDGKFHRERIWYPNGKTFTRGDETQEQANARELDFKRNRLGRLLAVMVPMEEVLAVPAKEWELFDGLASNTAKLLNKFSETNQSVDLKLVYDSKGQFPMVPSWESDWLESHIPGQPTKLKYSNWEADERTTRKSDSPTNGQLVTNAPTTGKTSGELDYDIV